MASSNQRSRTRAGPMLLLLSIVTTVLTLSASSQAAESIRGVSPEDVSRYAPSSSNTFTCLDGSATIPFSAVNDDYCDCADGSDEPGTSACPNGTFYCSNAGHIPATIRSERVNDGVCDEECCDGSDETDGKIQCPDRCAKVGREFRKRRQEEENIRRAGSKIRATYIAEANKKLESLQAEIAGLEVEIEVAKETESRRKAELESAEKFGEDLIEQKKNSPLYETLQSHQKAMKSLLDREQSLRDEMAKLTDLLDDLSAGYNPNYQDMAVKGAVMAYRSWRRGGDEEVEMEGEDDEEAAGEPPIAGEESEIKTEPVDELASSGNLATEENVMLKRLWDEGEWSRRAIKLMSDRDPLELMDDSMFQGNIADHEGILFRLYEYVPESVVPFIDNVVESFLSILLKTHVISGVKRGGSKGGAPDGEGTAIAKTRKLYNEASQHVRKVSRDLDSKREALKADPSHWGRDGEWKALEGKCIETNMGEYTYEYCFHSKTTQKPNRGGSNVSLGRFGSFEPLDAKLTPDDDRFFLRQKFAHGQKCWNGPDRSTIVDLECGAENKVLAVAEMEKCIYSMRVSTPAVCFPAREEGQAAAQGKGKGKPEPAQAHKEEL